MKTTTKEQIKNFLNSIKVENLEIMDYIDLDNIDMDNPFDSINEMIEDKGGFNIEIIYYCNAIEYLNRYDSSLKQSIYLASDLGYTIFNINSEILASLLATDKVKEDFYNEKHHIETFFNYLNK